MVETRSHRRRPGHRQPARHGAAAERPPGDRADLPVRAWPRRRRPATSTRTRTIPTVTISVAGGQANGITYIMDGGTHNDPFNNLNLPTPFPDALQEFKVETSALPARYGHHAASAVNLVTKSGTNKFHGDVFEFVRNYRFNARNFFAPARDSLKRNQFGGTLGGPIVKNKLFFFGGYQGRIERSNPPDDDQLRADARPCWTGTSRRWPSPACNGGRQVALRGAVRQQPRSIRRASARRAELPGARAGRRPIPAAASSTGSRTTTPSTRRSGKRRLHDQPAAERSSRATSTRSTTTRRPTTARTC